jgi:hypothetical protein
MVVQNSLFEVFPMCRTLLFRTLTVLLTLQGSSNVFSQNPVYDVRAKPQHAAVQILAISTSIRLGSGNQEVYLAEVTLKNQQRQLAKLVDAYASNGTPIQRSILLERHPLRMLLTRTPDCDGSGRAFFLPGDDSALFNKDVRSLLQQNASENIPCYTVRHEDTRLAK